MAVDAVRFGAPGATPREAPATGPLSNPGIARLVGFAPLAAFGALQWGALGVAVLYALWFAHLSLFRGEGLACWIGLLVVVQNMLSSLFNSHLFDFATGWIYVLGVASPAAWPSRGKQRTSSRQNCSRRGRRPTGTTGRARTRRRY